MRRYLVLSAAFAIVAGGCLPAHSPFDPQERRRYHESLVAESLYLARTIDTTYRRRMYDLIRRSRLVRTDSLARLYVALGTVSNAEKQKILQASLCHTYYLLRANGEAPFTRAKRHLVDSLASVGFDVGRAFEHAEGVTVLDPEGCDEATRSLPLLPDSINDIPHQTRFP